MKKSPKFRQIWPRVHFINGFSCNYDSSSGKPGYVNTVAGPDEWNDIPDRF